MDGEKMSKSLGNLVLVRDLLAEHEPDTIRLYLLRHHYRAALEWDAGQLAETAAWTRTLHAAAARASGQGAALDPSSFGPRFTAAMDDDLDTPTAVAVTLALADAILAAPHGADVAAAQDVLHALGTRVLGLWLRPLAAVEPGDRADWPAPVIAPPDLLLPPEGEPQVAHAAGGGAAS
jgi:cysteinyl-tRNA synthetase